MKLKSGLFGWKKIPSVSESTRSSHGRKKISTQPKSKNFEEKSVAQNLEKIPPKISMGGGESSANLQNQFSNNSNGERFILMAGNLSLKLKTGGQSDGQDETKKNGGE